VVDEPVHDSVALHLSQLLNQHLFRHCGNRTAQVGEPPHASAEQMKQNDQLPAALEDAQHVFDALSRGRLGVFLLTFR
jgi:hypothetical protein